MTNSVKNQEQGRRKLPPGTENLNPDIYGFLHIKIGKLLWLQSPSMLENLRLRIKFWGEEDQGALLLPANMLANGKSSNAIEYEIHCSVKNFHKYLGEMKRMDFHLIDMRNGKAIGVATLNIELYLKSNGAALTESPFDVPIVDTLVIKKLNNREKIGDLEIAIDCIFYPNKEESHYNDDSIERTEKKGSMVEPPNYIDQGLHGINLVYSPKPKRVERTPNKDSNTKHKGHSIDHNNFSPQSKDIEDILEKGAALQKRLDILEGLKFENAYVRNKQRSPFSPQIKSLVPKESKYPDIEDKFSSYKPFPTELCKPLVEAMRFRLDHFMCENPELSKLLTTEESFIDCGFEGFESLKLKKVKCSSKKGINFYYHCEIPLAFEYSQESKLRVDFRISVRKKFANPQLKSTTFEIGHCVFDFKQFLYNKSTEQAYYLDVISKAPLKNLNFADANKLKDREATNRKRSVSNEVRKWEEEVKIGKLYFACYYENLHRGIILQKEQIQQPIQSPQEIQFPSNLQLFLILEEISLV